MKMQRGSLDDGDFETLIEAAVRHAMSVVSISNNDNSEHRSLIIHSCERVSLLIIISSSLYKQNNVFIIN